MFMHACPHVGLRLDVYAFVYEGLKPETNREKKKKPALVDPVWGDHWPQTDHRVKGALPQPAHWNRKPLGWPGTKKPPALGQAMDRTSAAYSCMQACTHPQVLSALSNTAACADTSLQNECPHKGMVFFILRTIYSSADKAKNYIQQRYFCSARVYNGAEGPII